MATDVQEAAKEEAGIAKIKELQVPIVMYADDAINCAEEERANQQMSIATEKSANRDGTKISDTKIELVVLHLKGDMNKKNALHGR